MDDHIKALEEERKKIVVFERELPLSLQLITQAIEMYKQQSKLEVSEEEGVPAVHFLEEFIPLRPSCSSSDEENNSHSHNDGGKVNGGINGDAVDKKKKEKPDWLKSAQLWNQQPELAKGDDVRTPIAINAKRVGGAFHPFEREKIVNAAPTSSTSNDNTNGGCGNGTSGEEKGGHSQRKARRCWSTELHRSFLNALQQLGGPHVATPKQIRELMKVDGLSNDEVKSHLQKYRLHNRSLSAAPAGQANDNSSLQQPPQIVLVGSIWVQPPHAHATDASSNTAYFPVPSLPSQITSQQLQRQSKKKNCRSPTGPLNSERRSDDGGESMKSGSSNVSSSTSQTTTASPL